MAQYSAILTYFNTFGADLVIIQNKYRTSTATILTTMLEREFNFLSIATIDD